MKGPEEELQQLLASLKEQREELARKNDDLQLFFHAAAHDLRQPLRQVLGFARLLERRHRDSLADEGKEYLGFIEQVSARMEGLLDSLLGYMALGSRPLEKAAVDLAAAAGRALAPSEAGQPRAELDLGPLPVLTGDAELLEELFRRLFDNCMKYRHPDRVLKIAVRAGKAEGGWVLSVEDNGIGVPETVRPGLFKVLQRGQPQAHYPGYGISLAYCKRALELHGGWIRLADKKGPGARFEFFLPA